MKNSAEVTQLLLAWSKGDATAFDELLPLVYGELRQIAERYLRRERAEHTLQATALVHEAYLKLVNQQQVEWQNRAHFYGIAAHAMRRILIDHARSRQADKRGSGEAQLSLDENLNIAAERHRELIALDDALTALAAFDPPKSRLVELRYFGGLSIEETAEVMGVGTATVIRQWRLAKAWLHDQMKG
jgi:RNA polymerase sigma factor (TIGR02999 family)